jgi:Tfp pilus assembly protein PilV
MRAAFTLIEVLVAMVLFEFGMLALAATSAVTARSFGIAVRRARAQSVAAARVEQLRAGACATTPPGQATHPGFTESWRVEAIGRRRLIEDSVEIVLPQARRASVVRHAWALCGD